MESLERLRKEYEGLTAELLDEYVNSIEVLPGNEVRINWK